jgi:lipopolysaccharide/colanic/teichoic acid biosynthesis glycosyltransferase
MIAAAIAIKLTSRGRVFYRSERIGLEGEPFQMIKFRTMVDGADRRSRNSSTSTTASAACCSRSRKTRGSPRSGSFCAGTASTNCPSSSTSCGAK